MQRALRAPMERSGSLHSTREGDQVALKLRSDFREFCRGWVGWGVTCGGWGEGLGEGGDVVGKCQGGAAAGA